MLLSALIVLPSPPFPDPNTWPVPKQPPAPPPEPYVSDVITFDSTNGRFLNPGMKLQGSSGTYNVVGSCPLWLSDPDGGAELWTTPPVAGGAACSTFFTSGHFDTQVCVSGILNSATNGTTITGPDGSLTNVVYHVDLYAGLGILSGTATENETDGGVARSNAVQLYGWVLIEPLPNVASLCPQTSAADTFFAITGAIAVVEPALSS